MSENTFILEKYVTQEYNQTTANTYMRRKKRLPVDNMLINEILITQEQ